MKTVAAVFISFIICSSTYSQTTPREAEKIAVFCKVWGFLKYYHPKVAKGSFDWDKEFISGIKSLEPLHSKEEISNYYSEWISRLGKVKICKKCDNDVPDSLKFNLDLKWLSDSTLFTTGLTQQLLYIQQNRNRKRNHYVQSVIFVDNTNFKNEKAYQDSIFPSAELRLLGLSRYWNIYNYFFPYKYMIDQDWNDVLVEMIPKFKDAKDTIPYHLAMLELTAKVNDSHAGFATYHTAKYFGVKWAPFRFTFIDNKAIVTSFYNDSLCRKNDIRYGDIFLKINNIELKEIAKEKEKYLGSSNVATTIRKMSSVLFTGNEDSVKVTFERNGIISEKYIYRYYFKDLRYKWKYDPKDSVKIIEGNIGYVHLGHLKRNEVNETMEKLKNTRAIIFDIRNYPNGTMYQIAEFLNNDRRPFVKITVPDISYPGVYSYTHPIYCGKKNNTQYYKGKVVLLFNEETISHAEFTAMALQTAPNVISIGSQTAGADGNVSMITFPGGYETYMTGIGIYYPDGRETQRVGIIPDIEIKPTIEGLRLGKDEVLEKAIEVINK